jgi:hypothetical protein
LRGRQRLRGGKLVGEGFQHALILRRNAMGIN